MQGELSHHRIEAPALQRPDFLRHNEFILWKRANIAQESPILLQLRPIFHLKKIFLRAGFCHVDKFAKANRPKPTRDGLLVLEGVQLLQADSTTSNTTAPTATPKMAAQKDSSKDRSDAQLDQLMDELETALDELEASIAEADQDALLDATLATLGK